jgi:hypothetical protein
MPLDIGAYRVDGELVAVGNGQVAPATERATGRPVFIKVFDKYVMPSDEALATGHPAVLRRKERFERYQALMETVNARLRTACGRTANLVTATDFFRHGNKLVKVTDFVDFDGRPASEVHEAYTNEQIYQVFSSVLTSVQTLHGQGVVHADLKPENIFICRDGAGFVGRVSDFDDSFFADAVPDACDVTSSPQYYSPELGSYVIHAEDPDDELGRAGSPLALAVGRTHDVFALGLVLHCYLTGSLPQARGGGYVFEALLRHGDAGIRLGAGLSLRDAALIRWMLRADPAARPQTCAEVANALNSGGRGIPTARVRVAADDRGVPLAGMRARLRWHGEEVARTWGDARGRATFEVFDVAPDRCEVQVGGRTQAGRAARGRHEQAFWSARPARPVCFHWGEAGLVGIDGTPARPPVVPGAPAVPAAPAAPEGPAAPAAPAAPVPAIVFDPPRDGRYASLARLPGDRVLVRLADGTAMSKPLRELRLYGLGDCIDRL